MIDLRSDTVTRPSPAMRAAMANAEVGDDVYGEDPTVNRLEALAAELFASEAALFVAGGTQGNLLALLSHCRRGDEYIAGQTAHCYRCEGGGAAVLGGIAPQPLDLEADGSLDLDKVAAAIKPADDHFARTRLLCLENTQGGKVLSLDYHSRVYAFSRARGLTLHLDGARLGNAAVALGVSPAAITRQVDSVSVCLSKGLGAPAGTVLCGPRDFIGEARHWRKMVGGGMRQAGILAAAGIFALQHNWDRLADDHAMARILAEGLARLPGFDVDLKTVQSNMVFARLAGGRAEELKEFLRQRQILVGGYGELRFVTHLDVDEEGIRTVIAACTAFAEHHRLR